MTKKYIELKSCRAKCELNQTDLSQIIGVTLSTYCAKENGRVVFSLEEAFKINTKLNSLLQKKGYETLTLEKMFSR